MSIKLYSAWYCPFAQRAWMALLNKKVAFEYFEIDPYRKTETWLNISRGSGQVPVVETYSTAENKIPFLIIDSNRIVEFIDQEYFGVSALFSEVPSIRAEQKYWIDFVSSKIVPYFYRFLKNGTGNETGRDAKLKLIEGLTRFTRAMSQSGRFFSGESIDAVDISLFPFAYRINLLLKHYRNFILPTENKEWVRYQRWYQANLTSLEFKQTQLTFDNMEERLIDFYLPYSQGGGQDDVTKVA
ncbi:MAG: glutathione S-transferase N-terminal domain-containing protein [Kangiellaceae bacterium]|nr:glutathione S-transferase N-terminal domain-containing protein [Kangiellaceae bacterium]